MAKLKIAVISDAVYRAVLPWDVSGPQNYYGSEAYHALLAYALQVMNFGEIHFVAPGGSSDIGIAHPMCMVFGTAVADESLTHLSLKKPRETPRFLLDMDYVIDMSSSARHPEYLHYNGYHKYCCYRNGYNAFGDPKLHPEYCHYVVPSAQNQRMFNEAGFDSDVIYYGIPDFYCPGDQAEFFKFFEDKYSLKKKEYIIFPHRPGPEKGADIVLQLAEMLPKETFVVPSTALMPDHIDKLYRLKKACANNNLQNVVFATIPHNPWYHFFKRELMRQAKLCLSPFNPQIYFEGFGLASKECNACGIPVIITDSESTRELYLHEKDALIVPADGRNWGPEWFAHYITELSSYTFTCENRFLVEDYAANYMRLLTKKYNV